MKIQAFPRNNVDKINIANAENVIKYLMFNSSKPKEDCRAEKIYNLISQLDFLSSLESEILKLYDSYQKESRALYDYWNSNIKEIQRICAGNYTTEESDLIGKLIGIVEKWMIKSRNDSEVDVPKTIDFLVNPIIEETKHQGFKQKGFAEVDRIKESSLNLLLVFERWKAISAGFSTVFSDYANNAYKALSVLQEAKEYFVNETHAVR